MLTTQAEILQQFAADVVADVKQAITSKPILRYTPHKGSFSAPANASGNLAESVRADLSDGRVDILAAAYIDQVIEGMPPGTYVSIAELDNWAATKGIDIHPFAISNAIFRNGTSIWQEWQGANSGLLSDAIYQGRIDELFDDIKQLTVSGVVESIREHLKLAA